MDDLAIALGLVLVIEGILYAAFPDQMRQMLATMLAQPSDVIRRIGLISALVGLAIVIIVR